MGCPSKVLYSVNFVTSSTACPTNFPFSAACACATPSTAPAATATPNSLPILMLSPNSRGRDRPCAQSGALPSTDRPQIAKPGSAGIELCGVVGLECPGKGLAGLGRCNAQDDGEQ